MSFQSEKYIFFNRKRQEIIMITIARLSHEGYWLSDPSIGIPNPLEHGIYTQNGYKYHYVMFAHKDAEDRCMLVKLYTKVSGSPGSMLQRICYMKQIKPRLGDYDQWKDPKILSPEQSAFISEFDASSKRDIQFIEYKNPND